MKTLRIVQTGPQHFACTLLSLFFTLLFLLFLAACQTSSRDSGREVSADSLTAPISTPTPTPTADPRVTDLARVREGMAAPDFALEDVNSIVHRLSDYREKKNIILVFYRGHF